jgi:hypothetical protein
MYHQRIRFLMRWAIVIAACCASVWLIYRGNSYIDPVGPGLMVPTMCVLSALCLMATTIAMTFGSRERANAA